MTKMAFPNKIQNNRNELVNKIIKDIQSGKPFFGMKDFLMLNLKV